MQLVSALCTPILGGRVGISSGISLVVGRVGVRGGSQAALEVVPLPGPAFKMNLSLGVAVDILF